MNSETLLSSFRLSHTDAVKRIDVPYDSYLLRLPRKGRDRIAIARDRCG